MAHRINSVAAREILDSRGRPTLSVSVGLESGAAGEAGVPSGASTGTREAVELRDGDPVRFGGAGVRQAVGNVNGEIAESLVARDFGTLGPLDGLLVEVDGTDTKKRLGANAIVGVSMAAARAFAAADGQPLHRFLALAGVEPRLPVPCFNVINGGRHAANRLQPQEFMVCPLGAPSFVEALQAGAEVYAALRARLQSAGMAVGLGDEGGFAPELAIPEEGERSQLVGDDNFVTNPAIIARAIEDGIANAALIKLNQIGTVTETLEAMRLCRDAGYGQMVSHRSGETTDAFIADLAVATGCGQIKSGAPARGERVAKYNRLAAIEAEIAGAPTACPAEGGRRLRTRSNPIVPLRSPGGSSTPPACAPGSAPARHDRWHDDGRQ